jgi:(p)ppGpp synthase/HD superfamily hydrolase
MQFTSKIQKAIKFATKTHEVYQKQKRKGKDVSYITHPLTVGIILARAQASEDVVAAGILHDTIEDSIPQKKVTHGMLAERFGKRVADLVESVTERDKSLPWEERKAAALRRIGEYDYDSLSVKSADVVSNNSEILDDHARYGDEVFDRFSAPKEKMIQHHLRVIEAILGAWAENPLRDDLGVLARELKKL